VGAQYACRQPYAATRFPPRALLSHCPTPLTDRCTARVGVGTACDNLVSVPFRTHGGSGGVSAIVVLDLLEVHVVLAVGPLCIHAPPPPDPFDVHPRRRSPPMSCRRCLTCSTPWSGWWKRNGHSQATGIRPQKGAPHLVGGECERRVVRRTETNIVTLQPRARIDTAPPPYFQAVAWAVFSAPADRCEQAQHARADPTVFLCSRRHSFFQSPPNFCSGTVSRPGLWVDRP